MTIQTIQIHTFDYGASLSSATLRSIADDTLFATADSVNEVTADSGLYSAVFGEVAAIAAGDYRLRAVVAGQPINRYVTLAGTDAEVVQSRSERHAVLNPATLRAAVGLADANIDEQFGDLMTAVADVQTDVDANTGYLTALTTNMTTLLGRVTSQVYTMWTDLIAMITGSGSTPKFTTSALSNAPTGSGGAGGGQAPTIVTLQAVAGISPGVIVGPTEPLVIGDDYLTVMNRSIRINLLDEKGNPAEVDYGTYALDDSGISIYLLLARSGKPSVEAQIFGTCTFFPAEEVDSVLIPPYLIVEFTKVETAKAVPGAYDMQAEAVWQDGKVVTFAPYGQIQFVRDIRRA